MAVRSKKRCSRCGKKKWLLEFTKNRAKKDGMNHSCRECHTKYVRKHYEKNRGYYLAKAKRIKGEIRETIKRAKEKPCADCNQSFPYYVMDFDHVRGDKKFNLGGAYEKRGRKVVLAEMAKCDVVCANCHRIRTHDRLGE